MRKPQFSKVFKKQYKRLPNNLQKKFLKQLKYLLENPNHPSLRSKKMQGREVYEGRVDYHYRFTFQIDKEEIWLLNIGAHDAGLGKK